MRGLGGRSSPSTLDLEQSENAALIAAIAVRRGMPARAATIALATAYQESKLRNLEYGDRDSLGLFQQRPSQGWGTRDADPRPGLRDQRLLRRARARSTATRRCAITEAAQQVQRSGFPDAYADHEPDARVLASALTGNSRAGRSACTVDDDRDEQAADLDDAGLTGRAASVRADLARTFGELPLGGFAAGGVRDGHMAGSAHYEGRAIDVFVRPVSADNRRRGWAIASYLVGQADRLDINTVIFDDRMWTGGPALARGVARLPGPGVLEGRPGHPRAPRSRARGRRSITHFRPDFRPLRTPVARPRVVV